MNDKNVQVSITVGTFLKISLVAGLLWLLWVLRDIVLLLLTAVVIASAIEPATLWFERHRIPRVLGVLFTYIVALTALFGILYLFVPPLLNEASKLLVSLPEYLEQVEIKNPLGDEGIGGDLVDGLTGDFSLAETISHAQSALSSVSGNLLSTITTVFGGVFSFFLVIVISFYLAAQKRGIDDFLQIITPVKHERYIISLWKRSQMKIGLWMQGQLLLGLFIGILVYLGLVTLGVEHALLLAVLAAVFELIPLFGAILAAIPAIIIAFLDSVGLGLMVLGLYVIIQQFENHLIYPLVVRKVVGVSPIIVILALIIGGELAGFLGVVLAVPIAAAIMEFTDDIQREKRAEIQRRDNEPVASS